MSVDTARTIAILRGLTGKFEVGLGAAKPYYPSKATIFPSNGADEGYGGLGAMPGMREWLGDRIFHTLRASKFVIVNRHFESSLSIERDDIADDRLGVYADVLQQLGIEAACHPDELMLELQVAGESQQCLDGQYFYDVDHSWGDSGAQSNLLSLPVAIDTTPSVQEFRDAYHAARLAMLGFKNDQGKLFQKPIVEPIDDFVVEVPLHMQETATKALLTDLVDGGEDNVVLDKPKIVTIPALEDQSSFYLNRVGQRLKPFAFQDRKPLSRQMKGMDDMEFKDVRFMTDARYNVGYLAWWYSVKVKFTDDE